MLHCETLKLKIKKKTRIFDLQTHVIQKKSLKQRKYKTEKPKRIKLMFWTFLKNKKLV